MSNIYNDLNTVRRQTNSSLSTIIGVNSRNFDGFYKALKGFFDQIYFNETENSISLNTVHTNTLMRSDSLIEVGQPGQPANIILHNNGNVTAQSINASVVTTDKLRFSPYANITEAGLPGELVYAVNGPNGEGLYYYNAQTGWDQIAVNGSGSGSGASYQFDNGLTLDNGIVSLGGLIDRWTELKLSPSGAFIIMDNDTNGDEAWLEIRKGETDIFQADSSSNWGGAYVTPVVASISAGTGNTYSTVDVKKEIIRIKSNDIHFDGWIRSENSKWKLGNASFRANSVIGLDSHNYISVNIDGTIYNLAVVNVTSQYIE